jgi:transposase
VIAVPPGVRILLAAQPVDFRKGMDGGARHWAIVASLVATSKLNGVEPLAWLTDVLERIVSGRTKTHELEHLLPWAWQAERLAATVHA